MYSDEDNARVKRRLLYMIIGVVVFLILLIILILLVKISNENKASSKDKKISCTLEVLNNAIPNNEGIYEEEIEIGFKEISYDKNKVSLTKQTIGIEDSSANSESFRITKPGEYIVYGFVEDSKGNAATCKLDVEVELTHPVCTLKVAKGVEKEKGWYNSDVVVSFDNVNANNASAGVVKYFIEKSGEQVNISTHSNSNEFIVSEDGETKLTGYIVDTNGEQATCNITVKKDSIPPKCTLSVIKGNSDSSGKYMDNPVVGFEKEEDNLSGISNKGIGITNNYTEDSYSVTTVGKTTVYGYVKDNAGNEGKCSIDVVKAEPGSAMQNNGELSCTLHISSAYKLDKENIVLMPTNSKGEKKISITMTTKNATAYGMGDSENYNGRNEFVITNEGKYKIIGYAQNSHGVKVKCETPELIVKEGDLLYTQVKFGDYVAYDAGSGRNTGQICNESDTTVIGGWRVLDFDYLNKQVILVSAGSPECVDHQKSSMTTLTDIKSKAKNYINKNYAVSADVLSCNSFGVEGCKFSLANRPIHITNGYYILGSRASDTEMWAISPTGIPEKVVNMKAGIRIVITLNKNVITTGFKNGKWILTTY